MRQHGSLEGVEPKPECEGHANRIRPVLFIVVPCYNEEAVLPHSGALLREQLTCMQEEGLVDGQSRILLVDDGSSDGTWDTICALSEGGGAFQGLRLSRNRGQQNALLAGLQEAYGRCDITITIDADGQDDMRAMEDMVREYLDGCDVVYGVRTDRSSDTAFKRITAELFYKLMHAMGCEVVSNHADYRLISAPALGALMEYGEVNVFLRGMVPLVGFKSTCVYYERRPRTAGESHYSVSKMAAFAAEGITSMSVKPLRVATGLGMAVSALSFCAIIWVVVTKLMGNAVDGWASMASIQLFVAGIQLIVLGILGEYLGKVYLETKHRPRYAVAQRVGDAIDDGESDRDRWSVGDR